LAFTEFIIQAYGSVLAPLTDPEVGNLNRMETSLVGVATLRALGGVGTQLVSHVYGLMKASPHVNSESDKWLTTEEGVIWAINTIDDIAETICSSVTPKL